MDREAAEHETISLKLIELVKARELLYKDVELNFNSCTNSRLWGELAVEMNSTFGFNHRKYTCQLNSSLEKNTNSIQILVT